MFTSDSLPPRPVAGGLFGFGLPLPSAATEEYALPDIINALGNRKALDSRRALALALLGEPLPPFRRPEARVRIKHELQKDFWTDVEFPAISLGINPSFATLSILTSHPGDKTAFECIRRRDLILRAQIMGALPKRIPPGRAIEWAVEKKLSLPSGLVERVGASPTRDSDVEVSPGADSLQAMASKQEQRDTSRDWKCREDLDRLRRELTSSKKINKTQRRIIAGFAVRLGALKKPTGRNVVKKIVSATQLAGVAVSPDAVRDHVEQAISVIPPDVRKQLEQ